MGPNYEIKEFKIFSNIFWFMIYFLKGEHRTSGLQRGYVAMP